MRRKVVYPRPAVRGSRGEGVGRAQSRRVQILLRALAAQSPQPKHGFRCCNAAQKAAFQEWYGKVCKATCQVAEQVQQLNLKLPCQVLFQIVLIIPIQKYLSYGGGLQK